MDTLVALQPYAPLIVFGIAAALLVVGLWRQRRAYRAWERDAQAATREQEEAALVAGRRDSEP